MFRPRMLILTFSDDNHANIFGLPDDLQNQILAQQTVPRVMFGTAEKDLRDLIAASKLKDRFRGVLALQSPRFDMKISGKVEVFFDRFRPSVGRRSLGRGDTETAKQSAPR